MRIAGGTSSPCIQFFAFAALISLFILLSLSYYYRDRRSVETIITYYYYYLSLTTAAIRVAAAAAQLHNASGIVRYVSCTHCTRMRNGKQRREYYFPGCEAINYLIHTLLFHIHNIKHYCNKRILYVYNNHTAYNNNIIVMLAVTIVTILLYLYKPNTHSQLLERQERGKREV